MAAVVQSAVEFVGGPFDGHRQHVSIPAEALRSMVTIPVNINVLRILTGDVRQTKRPATSVACYRLQRQGAACRYEYVGATTAEDAQLQGWSY